MQREFILLLSALVLSVTAVAAEPKLYTVTEGNKVDANTFAGWKTWRAMACERCHGNEQQGLVGPSLLDSLKKLTKAEFKTTIFDGRPEKGMPPWGASELVQKNWENLYAYLMGRSDGAIAPGHVALMEGASEADAKPASDGASAGAKPANAKPANAKPANAKPADAKPADAKPADAKPAGADKPAAKAKTTSTGKAPAKCKCTTADKTVEAT